MFHDVSNKNDACGYCISVIGLAASPDKTINHGARRVQWWAESRRSLREIVVGHADVAVLTPEKGNLYL